MNPSTVNDYMAGGCGRCPLGGTPDCKVHTWTAELEHLRLIALDCGLTETVKWSVPCYTSEDNNVLIISALKECAAISFFKGSLLEDAEGILEKPGANSQAARIIRFTSVKNILKQEDTLRNYIRQAIDIEKAGMKVTFTAKYELEYPEELRVKFEEHPGLQTAFESLTPGRRRGYILHFTQPKQSRTRASRIQKCIPKIFEGKGFHDR